MTVAERMLESHPWAGEVDGSLLVTCVEACFECSNACTACADACLSEEAVADLRKCIRMNLDCDDVCAATGRLLTRQTAYDAPTSKAQLEACRIACATCAAECESHAGQHEHCAICAEACRRCESACAELLAAMK